MQIWMTFLESFLAGRDQLSITAIAVVTFQALETPAMGRCDPGTQRKKQQQPGSKEEKQERQVGECNRGCNGNVCLPADHTDSHEWVH